MHRILIFLIAGWSGFFLMAVELLSGRILAPYFGSSLQVWGAVITVFMVALSLGYLVGGKLSLREPSLAKLTAILLATALGTAPAVLLGDPVMERIFTLVIDPRYGSLLSATVLFFLPTVLAGMVSPYAVRLLVSDSTLVGHCAGHLFFVSTFGAAAGTLLTSFYLVLYLDIDQIFWMLIGISVLVASSALLLGLSHVKSAALPQERS